MLWDPLSSKANKAGTDAKEKEKDKGVVQCPRSVLPVFSGSRYFVYGLNLPCLASLPESGDLVVRAFSNREAEGSDCLSVKVPFSKANVLSK